MQELEGGLKFNASNNVYVVLRLCIVFTCVPSNHEFVVYIDLTLFLDYELLFVSSSKD